jgi:hypothetical protein
MKTSFSHEDEKSAEAIEVPAMEEVPEALTNISAKEVLINTSVEETELTHISDEEKMLTGNSAEEETLTNIPGKDMAHNNVLAEKEALTNVLAEEEALTNDLADDGAALTRNNIVSEAENDVIRVEYKITRHDPLDVGPGMDSKPHADPQISQNETKTITLSANIYVDDNATKSSAGETFDMPTTLESSVGDHSKLPSEKVEEVETTFEVSQSPIMRENVIIDNNKIENTTPAAASIKIETTPDDGVVSTMNGSLVQEFYHRELLLLQLMRGGQQQGPEAVLAGWLGRQPMPTDGGSGGGLSVDWSVLISVVLTCLFFLAVFLVHQLRRTTANRRRQGPNQQKRLSPLTGSPEEGELEEEEGGGSLYEYPRYCVVFYFLLFFSVPPPLCHSF